MKKFLFSVAMMAMALTANAQDLVLTTNDISAKAGDDVELVVSLDNAIDVAAWQMYIYAPEGIATAASRITLTDRYPSEYDELEETDVLFHKVDFTKLGAEAMEEGYTNGYLLNCYASPAKLLTGNSGEIVRIKFKAASSYAGDEKPTILIKNFAVADLTGKQTNLDSDVTTGIEFIINNKSMNADGTIYNLRGQRVEKANKGLYIKNGQKVVVK